MGRDGACSASGLPISHGDEVLMVPLARAGADWAAADWLPSGIGLAGAYDEDRGRVDQVEEAAAGLVFAKSYGFESCQAWAESFCHLEEPEPMKGFSKEWTGQAFALVRLDAWEALLGQRLDWSGWRGDPGALGLASPALARAAGEEAAVWIPAWRALAAQERAELQAEFDAAPPQRRMVHAARLARDAVVIPSDLPEADACEAVFGNEVKMCSPHASLRCMRPRLGGRFWLALAKGDQSPEEAARAVEDLARMALGSRAMEGLRMAWAPSRVAGPQFGGWPQRMMWMRDLGAIAEAKIKAMDPDEPGESPRALSEAKALIERQALEIESLRASAAKAGRQGPGRKSSV